MRHHLARYRSWALGLVVLALMMKLLVPAGYMPVISGTSIAIELCSGFGPEKMAVTMPGMDGHHGHADRSNRGDTACGFAGHAPASIAGADPILLAIVLSLIVATVFRMPVFRRDRTRGHLRPRLRDPPATV